MQRRVVDQPEAAPSADDPKIVAAKSLYQQGQAKYETMDYVGAIDLWTQAYASLDASPEHRPIRNTLVYNIATAQEQAFELDHQIAHLRQARGLLERYKAEYVAMYEPSATVTTQLQEVEARIATLDQKIAAAEQDPRTVTTATPEGTSSPAVTAPPGPPTPKQIARDVQVRSRDLLHHDPNLSPRYRSARALTTSGYVLIGVGAFMTVIGIPGAVLNSDGYAPQRTAFSVVAGVGISALITSAVLLAIGIPRKRAVVQDARNQARANLGLPPE